MQQRFLTDDEIENAKAMVGWQFWTPPIMFGLVTLGLGIGALGRNPAIIVGFLIVCSVAVIL